MVRFERRFNGFLLPIALVGFFAFVTVAQAASDLSKCWHLMPE